MLSCLMALFICLEIGDFLSDSLNLVPFLYCIERKWWYCIRDQTVRLAYVTSLWVEGKQVHVLCKPKTLSAQEMRQWATKYCCWEIMFIVWTVYASLFAAPPTPLIPLPLTSNGSQAPSFIPTTVLVVVIVSRIAIFGASEQVLYASIFLLYYCNSFYLKCGKTLPKDKLPGTRGQDIKRTNLFFVLKQCWQYFVLQMLLILGLFKNTISVAEVW
jgi:hypothetical protein